MAQLLPVASERHQLHIQATSGGLLILRPIVAHALGQQQETFEYDSTQEIDGGISAQGQVTLADGTVLTVTDRITPSLCGIRMDRTGSVTKAGSSEGVRLGLEDPRRG